MLKNLRWGDIHDVHACDILTDMRNNIRLSNMHSIFGSIHSIVHWTAWYKSDWVRLETEPNKIYNQRKQQAQESQCTTR